MRYKVLIVDDESNMAWLFRESFGKEFKIIATRNSEDTLAALKNEAVNLVMLDIRLAEEDGVEVLKKIKSISPGVPVIMMTAYASVSTAVEAMKAGASDYIIKPFDLGRLRSTMLRVLDRSVRVEAQKERDEEFFPTKIVAINYRMLEVLDMVRRVAQTEASILILGESGTGKELIARAIHTQSLRRTGPFIVINCAAIPESLLESELFGYEVGAFTGAKGKKPGKFEVANGGTLILDEIGDMPLTLQAKILRAMENREIDHLGGTRCIPVNIRVVASTNKDLRKLVIQGQFREDLYFRLMVFPITLPPLRERGEDIILLARHFLKIYASKYHKEKLDYHPAVLKIFSVYSWPGNIRELRNLIEQLVILANSPLITVNDIPRHLGNDLFYPHIDMDLDLTEVETLDLKEVRTQAEQKAIGRALEMCKGNRTRAARLLGISRRCLQLKLKEQEAQTPLLRKDLHG